MHSSKIVIMLFKFGVKRILSSLGRQFFDSNFHLKTSINVVT